MSDNDTTPNITRVDEEGEPIEGDVRINGIVPGEGGEGQSRWTETEDGSLSPANDEPVSIESAHINSNQVFVQSTDPAQTDDLEQGDVWIDNSEAYE